MNLEKNKINLSEIILSNMPKNLSDLEKVRYIYRELCNNLSFSTKFQNTDEIIFANMYIEKVDSEYLKSLEVICRTWAQLYSQLLNKVGIKNKIINQGHDYVELYIDNEILIADATYGKYTDLSRVKNGDDTVHFGYSIYQNTEKHSNLISITKDWMDKLSKIDTKLGYNKKKDKLIKF